MKWKDILEAGCTWEPVSHFIGDAAKAVLATFRQDRSQQLAAHAVAKAKRVFGKRPIDAIDTMNAPDDVDIVDGRMATTEQTSKHIGNNLAYHRRKSSDV